MDTTPSAKFMWKYMGIKNTIKDIDLPAEKSRDKTLPEAENPPEFIKGIKKGYNLFKDLGSKSKISISS